MSSEMFGTFHTTIGLWPHLVGVVWLYSLHLIGYCGSHSYIYMYLALYEKSQTVQTTFAFSSCTTVYDQSPADDPLSRMGRHEVILSWTNVMTKTCLMCQFTFSYTTFTNKYKEGTLRLPLLVKRDSDTGFSTFIMCSWIEPSLYNLQYDMLQYLPSVKVSLICTGSIRFRVVSETCVFILNLIEINSFL